MAECNNGDADTHDIGDTSTAHPCPCPVELLAWACRIVGRRATYPIDDAREQRGVAHSQGDRGLGREIAGVVR